MKFFATVHKYELPNNDIRTVIDPRTIPAEVREAFCLLGYWKNSAIGPNQHVAYFDLAAQSWRDMRNAKHREEFDSVIEYKSDMLTEVVRLPS